MQGALSGGSKVVMLLAVNPTDHDAAETLCSLNFAARLRGLEIGPAQRNAKATLPASQAQGQTDAEASTAAQEAKELREKLTSANARAEQAAAQVCTLEEELFKLQKQLMQHGVRSSPLAPGWQCQWRLFCSNCSCGTCPNGMNLFF